MSSQLIKNKALVIGANGTIGKALVSELSERFDVCTISRHECNYSDADLSKQAEVLQSKAPFQLIINCIGVLHDDVVRPEKRLSQLSAEKLAHYFHVNTIVPSLCIKYFHGLLDKAHDSVFVNLSAMVGSIEDNKSGGWYGYRSSKAALNMVIKTASIELARINSKACLVALHPGTTQSDLSRPFASNVDKDRYYTPQQSAQRILAVSDTLTSSQSGQFFNWDGNHIAW